MSETLVCIELPNQVPAALRAVRRQPGDDFTFLALTPHVEYALERAGLSFSRPEDFHTKDDVDTVGFEDIANLGRFCTVVDGFLQQNWNVLKDCGLGPADLNWYRLKILFNSVSIRAFIMRRVLNRKQPNLVLYFDTHHESSPWGMRFVRESAWSRVIPLACADSNVPCETLGHGTDPSVLNRYSNVRHSGLKARMRQLLKGVIPHSRVSQIRLWYRRAVGLRHTIPTVGWKTAHQPVPNLLALERSQSLGALFRMIEQRATFNVRFWDAADPKAISQIMGESAARNGTLRKQALSESQHKSQGQELWRAIRESPEFLECLHFSGIDCFPVMESRLRRFIEFDVPQTVRTYQFAVETLNQEKPVAVLASTMSGYEFQTVAEAARKEGVPVVIYRHGASGGHVRMGSKTHAVLEQSELRRSDYILAFGSGDVDYLGRDGRTHAQVIPVGSAALDRLRASQAAPLRDDLLRKFGLDPEKKTVMYVPTTMDGNIRGAPHRARSPSRMFELERRITEVITDFPEIQFVFKLAASSFHPCSPIVQVVKDLHIKNCIMIAEPFTSVMAMADMFLTDLPNTSFLEMLTTDRPILFCGYELPQPWSPGRWHPSVLVMWQERVAYEEDLEPFLEMFRTHLKERRFDPVRSDDTLLKLFGTHLDDGNSLERAHAFLESLAAKATGFDVTGSVAAQRNPTVQCD